MAKLTISEAARVAHVARSTLHRAINQGRLSADADGKVDTAELLRAGYMLQGVAQQARASVQQDATPHSSEAQQVAPSLLEERMSLLAQERELLQRERDLLQRELERAQEREQVALERERAAREREALLLHMLEQAQQQSQRLLDMPRSPATGGGVRGHREERPTTSAPDTRARILAYMQEHQGPQRPGEIEEALGLARTPRYVMKRMVERGVLRRVAPGVYGLAESSAQ